MKILAVANGGGHLTEMLQLLDAFEGHDLQVVTTPSGCVDRPDFLPLKGFLPRNPFRLFLCFCRAFIISWRHRPELIVSTGAEIALPFAIFGKCLFRSRVIYVECCAQVSSPSKTGRFIYPFCDRFFVQWPSMLEVYGPKAEFVGGLLCIL